MEVFGIRIRVHPTFLWLLLILLVVSGRLDTVVWTLIVFGFVVLHEVSHGLVARAHGVPVHDITLLPIGGVARLGAMPEHPATEFNIAIAGPVLNFVLAGLAYLLLSLIPGANAGVVGDLLAGVLTVNLALGTFNLLPAFPMDGGRLLRAYLATKRGYLEATRIAARVGRWIAAGLAAISIGTLFGPGPWMWWLLFIAGFIYVSGKQEEMAVAARHALRGIWNLFGYAEPRDWPANSRWNDGAETRGRNDDAIDVSGRIVDGWEDSSAADAFRKLAEEGRRYLGR